MFSLNIAASVFGQKSSNHLILRKTIFPLLLFLHQILWGQTNYFVGANGADNTGFGTATTTPFKTITYAVTQVTAGDTVNVLAGTYHNASFGNGSFWNNNEAVYINNVNGNAAGYITIRPYQNQKVVFKGDGNYIFQIRNSSFIRVQGFEIAGEVDNIPLDSALQYQFLYKDTGGNLHYRVASNTPANVVDTMTFALLTNISRPAYFNTVGLLIQSAHHIDIVNNHLHHTPGTGLRAFQSDYINFIANEINDCSRRSSVGNHGIVIDGSTSIDQVNTNKILIQRNKVHHNYNEVYSWNENKTFINAHIDEGKGISLQRNTVANGWQHGKINVENNLCYLNGFSGIHANLGVRIEIINNTCYLNSGTGTGNNIGISLQSCDSVAVYNNIIVADTTWNGFAISTSDTAHIAINTNLVQGILDADAKLIATNTLFSNPQFVNASTFDFNLQSTSPAINSAWKVVAPLVDFYGYHRDSAPDIGAIEFIGSTGIQEARVTERPLHIYPNPFFNKVFVENVQLPQPISIYNSIGQNISTRVFIDAANNGVTLYFDDLANGIYLIKVGDHTKTLVKLTSGHL